MGWRGLDGVEGKVRFEIMEGPDGVQGGQMGCRGPYWGVEGWRGCQMRVEGTKLGVEGPDGGEGARWEWRAR